MQALAVREAKIAAMRQELDGLSADLARTNRNLEEKSEKVRVGCVTRVVRTCYAGNQTRGGLEKLLTPFLVFSLSRLQIKAMEESANCNLKYTATLQTFITSLHAEVTAEKERRDDLQRVKDELQGRAAELGGTVWSLEAQLSYERVCSPRMPCSFSTHEYVGLPVSE